MDDDHGSDSEVDEASQREECVRLRLGRRTLGMRRPLVVRMVNRPRRVAAAAAPAAASTPPRRRQREATEEAEGSPKRARAASEFRRASEAPSVVSALGTDAGAVVAGRLDAFRGAKPGTRASFVCVVQFVQASRRLVTRYGETSLTVMNVADQRRSQWVDVSLWGDRSTWEGARVGAVVALHDLRTTVYHERVGFTADSRTRMHLLAQAGGACPAGAPPALAARVRDVIRLAPRAPALPPAAAPATAAALAGGAIGRDVPLSCLLLGAPPCSIVVRNLGSAVAEGALHVCVSEDGVGTAVVRVPGAGPLPPLMEGRVVRVTRVRVVALGGGLALEGERASRVDVLEEGDAAAVRMVGEAERAARGSAPDARAAGTVVRYGERLPEPEAPGLRILHLVGARVEEVRFPSLAGEPLCAETAERLVRTGCLGCGSELVPGEGGLYPACESCGGSAGVGGSIFCDAELRVRVSDDQAGPLDLWRAGGAAVRQLLGGLRPDSLLPGWCRPPPHDLVGHVLRGLRDLGPSAALCVSERAMLDQHGNVECRSFEVLGLSCIYDEGQER